jgi:hypothetical protein
MIPPTFSEVQPILLIEWRKEFCECDAEGSRHAINHIERRCLATAF